MQIEGSSAVVTGGGSGIGRAIVLALVRHGARVLVADIDEAGSQTTLDLVNAAGGTAIFCQCDVTRTEDLRGCFSAAAERFGGLDIAVNNAGIGGGDLFNDDISSWKRIVDINLTAVIDGTRIAVREMRRTRRGGVIINTASMGGLLPIPDSPVYAATKAGVVNFTRSLASLAEQDRIRVNAICPSFTDTPLVRWRGEEAFNTVTNAVGGVLQPENSAEGVIELIEDDSKAGAIMRVTLRGGRDFAREVRPF